MAQRTTKATVWDNWEQLAIAQTDMWTVVPRQVFTPYSRLLISTVFVVANCLGCLGVTGVIMGFLKTDFS